MNPGSPSRRAPRPGSRPPARPEPVERRRALGIVGGLLAFTAGFAAAGLAVPLMGRAGGTLYLAGISLGLVGLGLVGFFYHRGSVALPEAKVWSPQLLRAVIAPLGLPVTAVIAVLYGLAAVGAVGNLLLPMLRHR